MEKVQLKMQLVMVQVIEISSARVSLCFAQLVGLPLLALGHALHVSLQLNLSKIVLPPQPVLLPLLHQLPAVINVLISTEVRAL